MNNIYVSATSVKIRTEIFYSNLSDDKVLKICDLLLHKDKMFSELYDNLCDARDEIDDLKCIQDQLIAELITNKGKYMSKRLDLRMKDAEENLKSLCHGLRTIEESGIRRNLVVLMLQDMTGIGKTQINSILDALPKMEKRYLK